MTIDRNALAALIGALSFVFPGGVLYADRLPFGVVGSPIDLSANVSESILPGATVFQDSKPLFGTTPSPKQSAELLHLSGTGVNASGRSTNISGAFASSLAESDGNGGVGVSQLIFGNPGGSGQGVRQMIAQSLWTQTFVYNGNEPVVQIKLHLHIPALRVQLLDVPPRLTGPSASETAEASAKLVSTVKHPDGIFESNTFEFGLREFERQLVSGTDFINFGDVKVLGQTGSVAKSVNFNGDDFNPSFSIDSVSLDVNLGTAGLLQKGDTFSYVYTLTAQGTTHGFERGYDAFLGDPFGADAITDNLRVTVVAASVPEASTPSLILLGFAGLFAWRRHKMRSTCSRRV